MRGLFFLLLLSNLIYFAVLSINGTPDEELDPYRGVKFAKQGLTRLSELPPEQRPQLREGVKPDPGLAPWAEDEVKSESPQATIKHDEGAAGEQCLRVGGIHSSTQVQQLQRDLQKLGAERFRQGDEAAGGENTKYWVMLSPYPDLERATRAAAALKELDIKDLFVVRNGEYENAVSLGVFSTPERAQRRQAQIAALKGGSWKARIEEIGSPTATEYFWLSFRLGTGTQLAKVRGTLRKSGLSQFKEIRCE